MFEFDIVYKDIKLRVISSREHAEMIKELMKCHVQFCKPSGNPSYTLVISEDAQPKPGLYGKIVDKWFNYATADCYIDDDNKICYLNNMNADGIVNLTLLIQYFAANVFNRLLEIKGYVAFHSSCVENNGNGIMFVAGRNSGKTVCMLNMMHNSFNIVANDKCAVNYQNNEFNAYGIVQDVSIRMSKEFRSRPENQKYIQYASKIGKTFCDQNLLEGNNIKMSDVELANLNGVSVSEDAILKVVCTPSYNPSVERPIFIKLPELEKLKILRAQLLPLVHDTTSFLSNMHLDEEINYNIDCVINKMIELPIYYCEQNENTTEEFVAMVRKLSLS